MIETSWTKEEFQAYVLLYVAHSDYVLKEREKGLILKKVDRESYRNVIEELQGDNDYQSIQKILSSLKKHEYSDADIDMLFQDIKAVFLADETFSRIEQNLFLGLKRVLRK